jgi:hypothetical protein
MEKLTLSLLFLVSSFLLLAQGAMANDEIRNLQVDLKAKGFSQSQYYDNLESSSIIFPPTSQIQLQLTIKNRGNRNQTNIKVTGKLPYSVTPNNSPVFTIPQIAANNDYTQNFILTVKDTTIVKQALTKNDLSISIRSDVGSVASDNLYFYTNGGSVSNSLPKTGSSNILLTTILGLTGTLTTFKLRRLARGY